MTVKPELFINKKITKFLALEVHKDLGRRRKDHAIFSEVLVGAYKPNVYKLTEDMVTFKTHVGQVSVQECAKSGAYNWKKGNVYTKGM